MTTGRDPTGVGRETPGAERCGLRRTHGAPGGIGGVMVPRHRRDSAVRGHEEESRLRPKSVLAACAGGGIICRRHNAQRWCDRPGGKSKGNRNCEMGRLPDCCSAVLAVE